MRLSDHHQHNAVAHAHHPRSAGSLALNEHRGEAGETAELATGLRVITLLAAA